MPLPYFRNYGATILSTPIAGLTSSGTNGLCRVSLINGIKLRLRSTQSDSFIFRLRRHLLSPPIAKIRLMAIDKHQSESQGWDSYGSYRTSTIVPTRRQYPVPEASQVRSDTTKIRWISSSVRSRNNIRVCFNCLVLTEIYVGCPSVTEVGQRAAVAGSLWIQRRL
jgi:hypothetical protein